MSCRVSKKAKKKNFVIAKVCAPPCLSYTSEVYFLRTQKKKKKVEASCKVLILFIYVLLSHIQEKKISSSKKKKRNGYLTWPPRL